MSKDPVDCAQTKDVLVYLMQKGVEVDLVEAGASGPCSVLDGSVARLAPPHTGTPYTLHLPPCLAAKEVRLLLNTLLNLWTAGVRASTRSEILLQLGVARSGAAAELQEKRAEVTRLEQQQHTLDQAMVLIENLDGFGEEG